MSTTTFVLLSGTLTFGVPLLIAFHELWLLRRPPGRGEGGPRVPPPEPPRKPLPDCLIPRPMPKVRQLEDA